ncbi:MAG: DNA-binding NarL/FixJ family response regulator [Acidimicrobiales bacterium]|jgi:DNA-binding NarL/FixJ family response regulator
MIPIRVAIVDDHAMLLDSLSLGLSATLDIEVVETATGLEPLEGRLDELEIDVLLVDFRLGTRRGTEAAKTAAETSRTRVLLMSGAERAGHDAARKAGCSGFVAKGTSLDELRDAIRLVASGRESFPDTPS